MFPARPAHPFQPKCIRRLAMALLMVLPLVIGLLTAPAIGVAAAFAFQPGDAVTVSTDALNLRGAPATWSEVICVAHRGDGLTVIDGPETADGFDWYVVQNAAGARGWVAGEYLVLGSGENGAVFAVGDSVAVTTDALNLRAQPSLGASVLHVFGHADVMTVAGEPAMADGYVWYPVDAWAAGPVSGWVAGRYLIQMTAPQDPTETEDGFPARSTVRVDTDLLNLRTGPGLSYPVIRQLPQGTTFLIGSGPVVANGFRWYTMDVADQPAMGWVAGDFLLLVTDDGTGNQSGTDFAVGDGAIVDTPALNGRAGPGLSYVVEQILTGGAPVLVLDGPVSADGYHWYQVETATGSVVWAIGEGLTA